MKHFCVFFIKLDNSRLGGNYTGIMMQLYIYFRAAKMQRKVPFVSKAYNTSLLMFIH